MRRRRLASRSPGSARPAGPGACSTGCSRPPWPRSRPRTRKPSPSSSRGDDPGRLAGPVLASGRVGAEGPKEECGVFGVWAPGDDVARLTYFALFAQQHRGQEAAGMAVSDGEHILVFKELGLVSQVFDEATLSTLRGDLGIGHNRYS